MTDALESRIAEFFQRRHCVLVGSGTTALYCCFRALQLPATANILFPNITCETAVNAALFAGLNPVFCDVTLENYNLDPLSARTMIESASISAIVPTHIFGHLIDIDALRDTLDTDVPIIEDAAQAYGGSIQGKKAGQFGIASIVSFGPGKTLACGGGGAILTDDPVFVRQCREELSKLPSDESRWARERGHVMKEMIVARRRVRDPRELNRERRRILQTYKFGYLSQCQDKWRDAIQRQFKNLTETVKVRRLQSERLDETLHDVKCVTLPVRQGSPVLWRYSFSINDGSRDKQFESLSTQGVGVSKLFPPCNEIFASEYRAFSNSEQISQDVVNLRFPEKESDFPKFRETVTKTLL